MIEIWSLENRLHGPLETVNVSKNEIESMVNDSKPISIAKYDENSQQELI